MYDKNQSRTSLVGPYYSFGFIRRKRLFSLIVNWMQIQLKLKEICLVWKKCGKLEVRISHAFAELSFRLQDRAKKFQCRKMNEALYCNFFPAM